MHGSLLPVSALGAPLTVVLPVDICPLLPGFNTCGIAVRPQVIHGLCTVILGWFTYTRTQTQTLLERAASPLALYMTTIGPQLGAHVPTRNVIAHARTCIINTPKHDIHTYIHTYIHTQNEI